MGAARKTTEKSAKAYRSIGEAAKELGLPTHVLRYWESKFPRHVRPVKRPDGRRMFRPADLDGLRAIQVLVHRRGMTLKGARQLLGEQGVQAVLSGEARLGIGDDAPRPEVLAMQDKVKVAFGAERDEDPAISCGETGSAERLRQVLADMSDVKQRLDTARARKAA